MGVHIDIGHRPEVPHRASALGCPRTSSPTGVVSGMHDAPEPASVGAELSAYPRSDRRRRTTTPAVRATGARRVPQRMPVNLRWSDFESFTCGNGPSGTGTSRNAQSGCQPSETWKTSSRPATVRSHLLDVFLEHLGRVLLVFEPSVEDARPDQLVGHLEPPLRERDQPLDPTGEHGAGRVQDRRRARPPRGGISDGQHDFGRGVLVVERFPGAARREVNDGLVAVEQTLPVGGPGVCVIDPTLDV
jgi:hypothetical protein